MAGNSSPAPQQYALQAGTNNRLFSEGEFTYVYDNKGNRTSKTRLGSVPASDKTTLYAWDHRNRLTSVETRNNAGVVTSGVEYQYDHLNQLVRRVTDADGAGAAPAAQTVYVFDRGQVLLQFDGAGDAPLAAEDLSHRYLWGPMVDELLADEGVAWTDANRDGADDAASPHDTLWALADHLGTVRDLVDDAGVVRNHKSYDAFGRVTAETNAARDVAFGFTGKLLDDTTGLQNNLHRWYDAGLGAWVSEDPIGFAAGDANLYRYVGNGPTGATDPSGLAAAVVAGTWAGGVGGGIGTVAPVAGASTLGVGALVAAAGLAGYKCGQTIDDAGYNPFPAIAVGVVDGTYAALDWAFSTRPGDLPARGGPKEGSLSKEDGKGNGQIRDYDCDGNAVRDFDFGHDHTGVGDPHAHDWDWSQNPPRQPPREIAPNE